MSVGLAAPEVHEEEADLAGDNVTGVGLLAQHVAQVHVAVQLQDGRATADSSQASQSAALP